MRAHVIETLQDGRQQVANTIEVGSLEVEGFGTLVDGANGGNIGDFYDEATGEFTPPTAAQPEQPAFDDQVKLYDGIVQARIDRAAAEMGYGDPNRPDMSPILHAITYAEEPAVPKFQAEGQLLRAWRSRYWAACWPILQDVRDGKRPIPQPAALIAELDAAAPPPTPGDVNAKIAELTA